MILCIGEILADMVGNYGSDGLKFSAYLGGAPFNVAVNAKRAGAEVGFVGRVGDDVIGRFCKVEAVKYNLDRLDIQSDKKRNTTIAFVSLRDGERDFAFNRCGTADYNIDFNKIDFSSYNNLNIIHLGSLMLSEKSGREFAEKVVKKAKELKVKLSFDINFRTDIFGNIEKAKSAYKSIIDDSDILKFSDDELKSYTGQYDIDDAIKSVYKPDQLIVVTLGSRGSIAFYNGESVFVPSEKVKPIDTTGAGDAFFGTFLANIEGKRYSKELFLNAMQRGNIAGANATQFMGAIKL